MKKRNQGFTLIEMIIVIAVIAILSSIALPSYSNVIFQSQAAACASNRRSAETTLQIKLMLDEIEVSDIDSEFHKTGISCPAHGTLHVKYNEDTQMVSLECTKHTETLTQGVLNKFIEMCENFTDYTHYENNSIIRNEMFEQLGGTWNSIGFSGDSDEYYIQPYWNIESDEMYIFAGTQNNSDGGWHTGYIYNADNATWYHGKAFSIVNSNDIHSWDDIWEKMQENGWTPVDVEYEK